MLWLYIAQKREEASWCPRITDWTKSG
jgi:hypothetical protein